MKREKGAKRNKEKERHELENDIKNKKSLCAIKLIGKREDVEGYTQLKNRFIKREIANFRLGSHMWEGSRRSDGTRYCILCGNSCGVEHWIRDCPATKDVRKDMKVDSWITMYYERLEGWKKMTDFLKKIKKTKKKDFR